MSLKGTGTPTPRPYWLASRVARPMHGANTVVSEGFTPDLRKKLNSAGGTNAPEGPTLQVLMESGLENVGWALAMAQALARSQFSINALELVGLALMGRFRWCPPVKL